MINTTKKIIAIVLFMTWSTVILACGVVHDNDPNSIVARVEPAGKVDVEGGDTSAQADAPIQTGPTDPEKIYKKYCTICHQTGVAGAPKFKNKADWEPRIAQGIDALLQSSIKGKGGMPPKGTCMQCSDEALKATIEYMLP